MKRIILILALSFSGTAFGQPPVSSEQSSLEKAPAGTRMSSRNPNHPFLSKKAVASRSSASSQVLRMNVLQTMRSPILFTTIEDYKNGKIIPGYYLINVEAGIPYQISAKTSGFFTPASPVGSAKIPSSLFSVKDALSSFYIPLRNFPQVIIQGSGSQGQSLHSIDLKVDPPMNYPGDQYQLMVDFIITAQ